MVSYSFDIFEREYMLKRYKKWKKWQKRNTNGKFYQLLVLIGLVHSPSFEFLYL